MLSKKEQKKYLKLFHFVVYNYKSECMATGSIVASNEPALSLIWAAGRDWSALVIPTLMCHPCTHGNCGLLCAPSGRTYVRLRPQSPSKLGNLFAATRQ